MPLCVLVFAVSFLMIVFSVVVVVVFFIVMG